MALLLRTNKKLLDILDSFFITLSKKITSGVRSCYRFFFVAIHKLNHEWLQPAIKFVSELFSGLAIKFKLSINIAIMVIVVIAIFSVLILPIQKRVLDRATHDTCTVLLKALSKRVKGSLLLSYQDPRKLTQAKLEVAQTMQMGVKGLEYIAIYDREGHIAVSSNSKISKKKIPVEQLVKLTKEEKVTTLDNATRFEFYYPVKYSIKSRATDDPARRVAIGLASLGFSKKVLAQPIIETKQSILILAALVIAVSVLVIYFFAQKMVNQINALSHAAREVGRGKLDVHVVPRNNDELGQLALDFNRMVTHLREKLQMQKFLSKSTMQMIHQKGGLRVEPFDGERKQITILFSDIRKFSSMAEESEPEHVVRLVNIYFDLQTKIIEAEEGGVDKFMGDQIMAVFEGANMIEQAVCAAVEIQRAVSDLNARRRSMDEVTCELGIGINNGWAVMGSMGSKNRMDYTVIGDVVNIANRLCSHAGRGEIITEYNLARSLNGIYPTIRRDAITVKGRTKRVEISEIGYEHEDKQKNVSSLC